MYRPDAFDRFLLAEVKKIPDPELLKGDLDKALLMFAQAGADAMLKGLRLKDSDLQRYRVGEDIVTGIPSEYVGRRGKWVFIPNEK